MTEAMARQFGENTAFSATMDTQVRQGSSGEPLVIPAKLTFLEGKSRVEMDVTKMKGPGVPVDAADRLREVGMDKMVSIYRPDKKLSYHIFPGMQAYIEELAQPGDDAKEEPEAKSDVTELGNDMVDGRDCVKSRVLTTEPGGKKHESIVWKDPSLRQFPIKIETVEEGATVLMLFRDVRFEKPEAGQFEVPAGFEKHASVQAMVQGVMMKRMSGGQTIAE